MVPFKYLLYRSIKMASNCSKSSTAIQTIRASGVLALSLAEGEERVLCVVLDPHNEEEFSQEIRVTLAADSSCDLTVLEISSSNVPCMITERSTLGREARMTWRNVTLGEGKVTQDLRSEINGANVESSIDWIFFAHEDDHYDLSVRNVFLGSRGRGEIMMKGVAEGHAHVSARGMIEIGPKGSGTDTYLTQDVLMLDRTAKVDAIPGLEIKTNDVKSSHSATVRHVSPDDLFYFGSRGIPEAEARRVYIEGFLKDLTKKIADAGVRERVLLELERKFNVGKSFH